MKKTFRTRFGEIFFLLRSPLPDAAPLRARRRTELTLAGESPSTRSLVRRHFGSFDLPARSNTHCVPNVAQTTSLANERRKKTTSGPAIVLGDSGGNRPQQQVSNPNAKFTSSAAFPRCLPGPPNRCLANSRYPHSLIRPIGCRKRGAAHRGTARMAIFGAMPKLSITSSI